PDPGGEEDPSRQQNYVESDSPCPVVPSALTTPPGRRPHNSVLDILLERPGLNFRRRSPARGAYLVPVATRHRPSLQDGGGVEIRNTLAQHRALKPLICAVCVQPGCLRAQRH